MPTPQDDFQLVSEADLFSEAYSEPYQTSMLEFFAKTKKAGNNFLQKASSQMLCKVSKYIPNCSSWSQRYI